MTTETVIDLGTVLKFPVGSARGIKQRLELIENGSTRRTVNGTLVDLTRALSRKYRTSISCSDQVPPSFSGLYKGASVTLKCVEEIVQWVPAATTNVTTTRTLVSGSCTAETETGAAVTVTSASGTGVVLASNSSGCFVRYRPSLSMLVTDFNVEKDEYETTVSWSLMAEEV